jgi:hypothetical protein
MSQPEYEQPVGGTPGTPLHLSSGWVTASLALLQTRKCTSSLQTVSAENLQYQKCQQVCPTSSPLSGVPEMAQLRRAFLQLLVHARVKFGTRLQCFGETNSFHLHDRTLNRYHAYSSTTLQSVTTQTTTKYLISHFTSASCSDGLQFDHHHQM